jgi:hypothetical protein
MAGIGRNVILVTNKGNSKERESKKELKKQQLEMQNNSYEYSTDQ